MGNIWIIAIGLFLIILFFYWRISKNYFKNEVFSKGTWKTGVTQLSYWQGAILVSSVATTLILFILKWTNILTF
ncbi:MAG: hypothetical protein ACJ0QQ_08420 [Parvicellaceae bacterium]|jgi:hypothetical protein|tara:strand:+ start:96 stop:317 length:222 start_codon:yes stop_codon:yes gene_type:complete